MKVLSLFSGIGAFEKALSNLGVPCDLVGYCEIDKYASKSYSAIHGVPESMNLGDITKVDETQLPKDIDLITYGFPCQDISIAGNQKGLFNADGTQTRSGLFFEALRIIQGTKPKVAIAENVKNLTGQRFKEQFKTVLDSLEQAGYNNYWQVLNLKDFGIPQNRERVFIVSIRKGVDTGLLRFPQGFPLKLRLKDMLETEEVSDRECANTIVSTQPKASLVAEKGKYTAAAMRGRYNESGDVEQRIEVSDRECANTITSVQKDSLIAHSMRIRKLTPKECFRLMGFEDADYEKAAAVNSNTQLYKQAGNSIGVPVVQHIMQALFDCGALGNEVMPE